MHLGPTQDESDADNQEVWLLVQMPIDRWKIYKNWEGDCGVF